jgi:hypothetical protein
MKSTRISPRSRPVKTRGVRVSVSSLPMPRLVGGSQYATFNHGYHAFAVGTVGSGPVMAPRNCWKAVPDKRERTWLAGQAGLRWTWRPDTLEERSDGNRERLALEDNAHIRLHWMEWKCGAAFYALTLVQGRVSVEAYDCPSRIEHMD